ncbi:MAG: glycerate kinase [Bryobacterales bacterium]|nr:glycerate kinase [Bryobacteraceae bacterium]MDW8129895.1 glycerate kinase [Bryobacterales bacterium]
MPKYRSRMAAPQPELRLRRQARVIFLQGVRAADPFQAVLRNFRVEGESLIAGRRRYSLAKVRDVYVVGAGKASALMAAAVERVLGGRIRGGLINVKYGHTAALRRIELNECGHPVPDSNGLAGARRIMQIVRQAGEHDLVICLISGGASALMPAPAPPITLEEKQQVTRLLLASGATIHEINAVRKHLSEIKGGQLARLAFPARVLALLLSDVVGDRLDVIGSGPTAPDPSTFADALAVLDRYGLRERVPASVRERLERGAAGQIPETPKAGDPAFERTLNLVVGSNRSAVDTAAAAARRFGLRPLVLSTTIEGETREVARVHAAIAREILTSGRPVRPPACLISGGETTVTLRGKGLGGRNQEFVLAAAIELAGLPRVVVLSGGTDGTDGPTDAAGAIADGATVARAERIGLDARKMLDANDSYHFFEPLGDLLKTGPTNTNVMDLRLVLVGKGD